MVLNPPLKQVPVLGQICSFTKTAMKVYNTTSVSEAVKLAGKSIIDDCSPPQIKYPVKCGIFIGQVAVAISSGGNSWAIALTIGAARQIID